MTASARQIRLKMITFALAISETPMHSTELAAWIEAAGIGRM